MHVLCPHCQGPIELLDLPTREIVCPSCGSSFQLEHSTTDWRSRSGERLGKFAILSELGMGAFGTVYKARDTELDRIVALKVPRAGNLSSQEDQDRFLREARSAAQLRHPNIVPLYEVGQAEELPYLVSAYVQGVTLADLMTAQRPPARQAAELVAAVADALQYAHEQGVIHRDVKPSNIMIGDDGMPYLMDFGLAKREAGEVTMTVEGQVLGTPAYMSPEQARGEAHQVDGRSDLYSLGVILFRLLTGELPFRGNPRMLLHQVLHDEPRSPRSLNDRIPRDLETIGLRALAKEPHRRYQSARAFGEDLRRWLKGEPIQARPITVAERAWRWCKRKPMVAALGATVLGLLLFVALAAPLVTLREANLRSAAEAREREANTAQASEVELRRGAERLSLRLMLEKAWNLPEQGHVAEGMLWLVRSLEMTPADDADLRQAIRANLAAWHEHLHSVRIVLQQGSEVCTLAFSPDGARLASGGADGTVRLWNPATGEPIGGPLLHGARIQALTFSNDGKRLFSGTDTPAIYTWDTATLELLGEPLRNPLWLTGPKVLGFGPGGVFVAAVCQDHTTRVWETATGKAVGEPLPLPRWVCAPAFSPDGAKVVICESEGRTAKVWNFAKALPAGMPIAHPASIASAAFSPDGTLLVVAGFDNTARVWDAIRGAALGPPLRHRELIGHACFGPDGGRVLTCSDDKTARVWDAHTGKPIGPTMVHSATVGIFSPDGRSIVTGSTDGSIRICRIGKRQPVGDPLVERQTLFAVSIARDGRRALTACLNGTVQEWDLVGRKPLGEPIQRGSGAAYVSTYRPDGSRVLTAGRDQTGGTAQQWDAATRQPLGPPLHSQQQIMDAAYSPDGSKILTASRAGTSQLWDAMTGQPLGQPLQHDGLVHAAAFDREGARIITASYDKTARVWDARSLQPIGPPFEHADPVSDARFSPDGILILTATNGGLAQLWDAARGRPVGEPMRHAATIRRAVFSQDGRRIVTASHDGTARVWDTATRRSLGPPLEHDCAVKAVAISLDGSRILTGGADGNAWAWDAPPPAVTGDQERIKLWVQVVTGQELDGDSSHVRVLDFPTWEARRQRLAELGGPVLPASDYR